MLLTGVSYVSRIRRNIYSYWSTLKREYDEFKRQVLDDDEIQKMSGIDVHKAIAKIWMQKKNRIGLRNLARVVEILLVQPMSSVVCERDASLLKRIYSVYRSRLRGEKLRNELFMLANGGPEIESMLDEIVEELIDERQRMPKQSKSGSKVLKRLSKQQPKLLEFS